MNSLLLQKLPDSRAGEQMRWYLGRLISAAEGASPEDRARYTPELRKGIYGSSEPEDEGARWRRISARLGDITDLTIERAAAFSIRALLATAKGHKWWLTFEVEVGAWITSNRGLAAFSTRCLASASVVIVVIPVSTSRLIWSLRISATRTRLSWRSHRSSQSD
jgi:hypothetical protein